MANTSVFTGADGSLALSAQQTPEGEAAQASIDAVRRAGRRPRPERHGRGRLGGRPFHEIGQRYATQLRPGNVEVRGTIGRAYINGAMLKLMLGEAARQRPGRELDAAGVQHDAGRRERRRPGVTNTVTLHDVKIDSWSFHLPEDDFLLESVGFQALFLTVADEG